MASTNEHQLDRRIIALCEYANGAWHALDDDDRYVQQAVRRQADRDRKVLAYDRARSQVKVEGQTRAAYMLLAEEAERRAFELDRQLDRLEWILSRMHRIGST